jgi:CMP-N,N'-diacetyllegionaminic acid synthase
MDKDILLTIAARGGSKGVKNKNIREICGLPLIAHTINQAKKWGRAEHLICSTDSDAIAETAKKHGAEVFFKRPPELAGDTAGKVPVLRHALKEAETHYGKKFRLVVDLDVSAPVRKIEDIEGAYRLFMEKKPKTVFSGVHSRRSPYFNMVEADRNGWAKLVKELPGGVARRQDAPKVYDMNASIYVYDRDYLIDDENNSAVSDRSLVWEMDELSAFDIDSEMDFQFIEFLVQKGWVKL